MSFAQSTFWSRQGTFDCPTTRVNTLCNDGTTNLQSQCPFVKRKSDCAKGKNSISTISIVLLFFGGLPSHISNFIVLIMVKTTNRMRWRRCRTNVREEVFKLRPALANLNTTTTIARETLHGRIAAASNHAVPGTPLLRAMVTFRMAMPRHKDILVQGAISV